MLHAVIRSGRDDAFHFFGEVSGYNLQTLRDHVRQTVREDGLVHLRLEIDPADRPTFDRCTEKWLSHLTDAGAVVEVEVMRQQ